MNERLLLSLSAGGAMTLKNSSYRPPDLEGRVALVAGATRGVGRGTALALGEAGATVYCTGRSTRISNTTGFKAPRRGSTEARKALPADYYKNRPETIEETAEMVIARGGKGIPVVVDHLEPENVEKLIARIRREQGELHALVNDISESAEHEFGKTFWQADLSRGFAMFRNAVHTHIITSHFAAPLLIESAAKKEAPRELLGKWGEGISFFTRKNLFSKIKKTTGIRKPLARARKGG